MENTSKTQKLVIVLLLSLMVLFFGVMTYTYVSRSGKTKVIIEAARVKTPLLLLDDVFSELDGKRRHALTDFLAPYQTFITTTDADIILKNFTQKSNVIALG